MVVVWILGIDVNSPILYAQKVIKFMGEWNCEEIWTLAFTEEASKHFTIVEKSSWKSIPCAPTSRTKIQEEIKVLKRLMTVVIIFALCWLPVYSVH